MHIPDSAISPATCAAAGAAMAPVWWAAGRFTGRALSRRQIPTLALGSAFSFTIMLFNIPAPGGTTVHAVGAGLLASLLGPWPAVLGITVALALQALFFGDGGILALAANCFTMAFAMPLVSFLVYRVAAGSSPGASVRRAVAAGIGAYVGVNVAALLTALFLGIQPALYRDAQGHALYFPWGLAVTLPAMVLPHLAIGGLAEAAVTFMAIRYLQAVGIVPAAAPGSDAPGRSRFELAWAGLAALLALSPLGLLAAGEAWGEWSADEVARRAGYMPSHLAQVDASGWKGWQLLPDYLSEHGPLPYIAAGAAGVAVILLAMLALGRLIVRRPATPGPPSPPGSGPPADEGEVPSWLLADAPEPPAGNGPRAAPLVRTRRRSHVEKTLAEVADSAAAVMFGERWARQPGLLQRLDARAKLAGVIALIVVTSLVHGLPALAALYLFALALAIGSRVPLGVLLRRAWAAVALFGAAAALPLALNLATPGEAAVRLWGDPELALTYPGLALAARLLLRVATAVSFGMLLAMTTPWADLLAGLRALMVPRAFVMTLAMTYRYLGAMFRAASDMLTARRSRSVGRAAAAQERRFVAGAIGSLFGRTLTLTDQVCSAMAARGWTGSPPASRQARVGFADAAWLACVALAVGGVAALERAWM